MIRLHHLAIFAILSLAACDSDDNGNGDPQSDVHQGDDSHDDHGDHENTELQPTENPQAFDVGLASFTAELIFPSEPKVGLNTFYLEVIEHDDGDRYDADEFTVAFTPDMPSMGHGSPDNVQPVYTSGGRYEGTVNFTMPGGWRLVFELEIDGITTELTYNVNL